MKKKNRIGTVFIYLIFIVLCLAILYPFLCVLSVSLSSAEDIKLYGFRVLPKHLDFSAYSYLFRDSKMLWQAYGTTIFVSVVGTAIGCLVTSLYAYAISRTTFRWRGVLSLFVTFTMFFSGGLIPTYLLINNLGLLDSMWAVILPGAFSVWNMIIARTYYQGIPRELREAADVDGASEMLYFFKILLPVCMPVVAVLALWQFVAMWNSYFDAMIYLNSASKQPLQLVLRSILIQSQPESGMIADIQSTAERAKMAELLKYATIIISSLPLLVMYPFFQKYFDAGIMAGSIKG